MAGAEWLLRVVYWVTLILTVQGATELNATRAHQYFTSPNYPADYPHNTIEYWHIKTDIEGTVIELDVVDSYLEYSYSCSYDYIQVYDGENSDGRLLKDFCGSSEPKLKSSGRHMYIKFRSDGTVNYRGFKMRYSAEDPDVNVGLIVGCVFAAIAGVAIIGCIVFFVCQAKSSAKQRVRPNNNTIAMTTVSGYPSNHAVVYTGQGYGWVQPQPMMGAHPPPYAAQPPAYATLGFGQNPQGVNNAAGSNASAPPPNSARGQQPPPYPGVHNPTPSRNAPPPPSTAPPTGSAPRPITAGFGAMPPSSTAFQDPAYPPPPASYQEL